MKITDDPLWLRQFWIPEEDIDKIRRVRETGETRVEAFPMRIMTHTMRVIDYKLYEEVLAENIKLKAKLKARG